MKYIITAAALVIATPAGAGEVLKTYLPHMRTLADWQRIPYEDQHAIAKEVTNNFDEQIGFKVCMDHWSGDMRYQGGSFTKTMKACVALGELETRQKAGAAK